jgi:quercetin dioxygenase-like cupin family protein
VKTCYGDPVRIPDVNIYNIMRRWGAKTRLPSAKIGGGGDPVTSTEFQTRTRLLEAARAAAGEDGAIPIGALLRLMRAASAAHPYLSSLYFAGAEGDHAYALQTEAVALGVAVLPEDAAKAGRWKRHPHQTEVMVGLEGAFTLETRSGDAVERRRIEPGGCAVIPPDVCHRVVALDGAPAAFLFVKTNPAREPRAHDC